MEEFVIENMMETVLLGSGKKWYTFPFKWNSGELWVDHSILFCYFGVGKHSKDPLKSDVFLVSKRYLLSAM